MGNAANRGQVSEYLDNNPNSGVSRLDINAIMRSSGLSMNDIAPFLAVLNNPSKETLARLNPEHVSSILKATTSINIPAASIKELLTNTNGEVLLNAIQHNQGALEQLRQRAFELLQGSFRSGSANATPSSPSLQAGGMMSTSPLANSMQTKSHIQLYLKDYAASLETMIASVNIASLHVSKTQAKKFMDEYVELLKNCGPR